MLSGGQKQRVALARAFLKPAPIMLLDDPVSQVDAETAAALTAEIEKLGGSHTVIVVSHRFAIFRRAQQIVVLDQGRVAACGSHRQLLEENPYYAAAEALQAVTARGEGWWS